MMISSSYRITSEVWGEVQQALSGFEGGLGQVESAAGVAVDAHALAFGAVESHSGCMEDVCGSIQEAIAGRCRLKLLRKAVITTVAALRL
jgi:hypothetical protein